MAKVPALWQMWDELEKGFMNAERAGTSPHEDEGPKLGIME